MDFTEKYMSPLYISLVQGVIEELIVIPFHNMVHSCHMRWTASARYQNWYQDETAHLT